ncbi:hypothetical protein [Pedobacter panaciterrae]
MDIGLKNNGKIMPIIIVAVVLLVIIPLMLSEDIVNFIVSILSLIFTYFSILSINRNNLKSYNVFALFYFGALFTSTWSLSSFQTPKNIHDIYFYFIGPSCFILVLYLFEIKQKIYLPKVKPFLNIHLLYTVFLVIFIGVKLYIGFTVGWRIDSLKDSTYLESGRDYVIPGVSGLVAIIQWQLLIFAPYVKRKYVICAVVAIVILTGILHVKRGDVIRLMMFLFIWFLNNQLNGKGYSLGKKVKTIVIIIFGFLLFVESGNIRQTARGGSMNDLKSNIGMNYAPVSVAWFYGYVSINFEVVRYYFNTNPSNAPSSITSLFSGEDETTEVSDNHSINGFNASTFIAGFIKDYNYLYFLEMTFFGLIIGTLLVIIKGQEFIGVYLFILSFLALSFFGNYLSNRSIFFAILSAMVLYPFLRLKKSNNKLTLNNK